MATGKRYYDPHMAQKAGIEALLDEQAKDQGEQPPEGERPPKVAQEDPKQVSDPPIPQLSASEAAFVAASLRAEVDQLRHELQAVKTQAVVSRSSGGDETDIGIAGWPWAYYKRANRGAMAGWIVYAPGGQGTSGRDMGAVIQYQRKGSRLLEEYGAAPTPSDVKYPGQEFAPLLRAGGAKEFPVSQILQYKWHVNPPIAGLEFPQVKEAIARNEVVHFDCPDCAYETWCLRGDQDIAGYAFRHLRAKVVPDDGRHGYPRQEAIAMLIDSGFSDPRPYYAEDRSPPLEGLPPRLAPPLA